VDPAAAQHLGLGRAQRARTGLAEEVIQRRHVDYG
jgi:hypothetical protein